VGALLHVTPQKRLPHSATSRSSFTFISALAVANIHHILFTSHAPHQSGGRSSRCDAIRLGLRLYAVSEVFNWPTCMTILSMVEDNCCICNTHRSRYLDDLITVLSYSHIRCCVQSMITSALSLSLLSKSSYEKRIEKHVVSRLSYYTQAACEAIKMHSCFRIARKSTERPMIHESQWTLPSSENDCAF
jgi:hypothetical protein